MKVIKKLSRDDSNSAHGLEQDFIDIDTIRRRVAKIKNTWTPDTCRARAEEGIRRRNELESLVLDLLTDTSASEETCDLKQHGFCLVG